MTRSSKSGLVLVLVGVVLGFIAADFLSHEPSATPANAQGVVAPPELVSAGSAVREYPIDAPSPALSTEEERGILVYKSASPSVVNIDTKVVQRDPFFMLSREAEGSGSGAIVDRDGHIVTNYHVIDGAEQIQVTLASSKSYPATLVGGDPEHDIAVLKIDAPPAELIPLALGDSGGLQVGQRVFALGNPFGWDGTMTTGIISNLNRNLPSRIPGRQMESLIQTDAAMNPGNSGGPLLDSAGQMIGMCVAIATRTGQSAGVGFAIPIDRIKSILPQLIAHGRIVRGDIGIVDVVDTGAGLVIRYLDPEGPAAQAGLRGYQLVTRQRRVGAFVMKETTEDRTQADRIVAVDGQRMRNGVEFRDTVWAKKPGDKVVLTIIREGRQMEVPVTLGGGE